MTETRKARIDATAYAQIDRMAQNFAEGAMNTITDIALDTLNSPEGLDTDEYLDWCETDEGFQLLTDTENALADLFIQRFRYHA